MRASEPIYLGTTVQCLKVYKQDQYNNSDRNKYAKDTTEDTMCTTQEDEQVEEMISPTCHIRC